MNTVNVGFTQMKDATQADYDLLEERLGPYLEQTPQRIMDMLDKLLAAFVEQKRMKISARDYDPCYLIK